MPRTRRAAQLALDGLATPQPSPPRVLRQSERDFMAAVVQYAMLLRWTVWHDQATNAPRQCWQCGRRTVVPRNAAGLPDLILVRRPRVVWAELKREGQKPSPEQAAWLDELAACGQEVYVWTNQDWPVIEKVLRDERVT